MRRFYIDKTQINGFKAFIKGQDAKHLKNVLRLETGDVVCLFDGMGKEYEATIHQIEPGHIDLRISKELSPIPESPVNITVAQAFLKDKKMDTLVRQLTELGMVRFLPFYAERSVPKPDGKRMKARRERWEKIAIESLKQCERSKLPEVLEAVSFDDVLSFSDGCDLKIFFWENEHVSLASIKNNSEKWPSDILIVIGPEGGFSDDEVSAATQKGFITASLGPRVLKAETASVAALTLMQYVFGDFGENNS